MYVITRTARPALGKTQFFTGNPSVLVRQLKVKKGKNIYCDGGAKVINELLRHNLVDELIISVTPLLLGQGTRLFNDGRPEQALELVNTKAFDTGLVQLHYRRKR